MNLPLSNNICSPAQVSSKPYGCKKCYMGPLGDFYTVENNNAEDCSKNYEKESNWKCSPSQIVSQSSSSTPTAIPTKELVVNKKDKITNRVREADFLEFTSNPEKVVKTYRNTKTKSLYQTSSPCPGDKKIKESKNEMVKKQSEGCNIKKIAKRDLTDSSSSTQSEFMAAVDLDKEFPVEKRKHQKNPYDPHRLFVMNSRNCAFPVYSLVDKKYSKRKKNKRGRTEHCRKPYKKERRRCSRRCIKPTSITAQCPKKKMKCCSQHEKPRKQHCREKRNVEKCRESHYQPEKRPERYAEDHHFKPSTAYTSRHFKKRPQQYRENEDRYQQPETPVNKCTTRNKRNKNRKSNESVCHIRKFFRDVKGFLPSFSDWNFFSDDKSKKKYSNCTPKQQGNPLQVYYVQTAKVDSQGSCREGEPEHLKKCKCIRQFLKTQETKRTRDWPGSRPLPPTSDDYTTSKFSTSEYNTSTTVSPCYGYETVGGDLFFKIRRPEIYYADCPTAKECSEAAKCERKKLKQQLRECKRRAKLQKYEEKRKKKMKKMCLCNICGNVHKKGKGKKKKPWKDKYNKDCPIECPQILPDLSAGSICKPTSPECVKEFEEGCCETDEYECEVEDVCKERNEYQGPPFFSFLRCIWSNTKQKPRKSLGTKFRELRYLKTCSSSNAGCGGSVNSEKRKKKLRYTRSPDPPICSRQVNKCNCRRKCRKPCIRPKKCSCPKCYSSASGPSRACRCQPILQQIECRLESLENRLKNRKKYGSSGSTCDLNRSSPAYYCVYPQLNRGPRGDADLQLATQDNKFFLDSKLQSSSGSRIWKKTLKPKLSSLYYFFKYISRHGKEKGEGMKMKKSKTDVINVNDDRFDDFTSDPLIGNPLKPEPEHKMKTKEKIIKLMKSKRTIKEKDKTEEKGDKYNSRKSKNR